MTTSTPPLCLRHTSKDRISASRRVLPPSFPEPAVPRPSHWKPLSPQGFVANLPLRPFAVGSPSMVNRHHEGARRWRAVSQARISPQRSFSWACAPPRGALRAGARSPDHTPPAPCRRQHAQGVACVWRLLQAGQQWLPLGGVAHKAGGGCSKGPRAGAWPLCLPAVPRRVPPAALRPLPRRQDDAHAWTRGPRSLWWIASRRPRRRMWPMPGSVWSRDQGWASGCGAVVRRERARALRRAAYEGRRARATARGLCPAGASQRSALPSQWAVEAIFVPISGRWSWLWGLCPGEQRAARWRLRGGRRRSTARVARRWAGETAAWGRMPPRRRAALFWAAIVSFCAVPPWRAVIDGHARGQQGGRVRSPGRRASTRGRGTRRPLPSPPARVPRP